LSKTIKEVLKDEEYWEAIGLKLSARNRLNGIVKEVEKGEVTASVKIEIKMPTVITAVITKEAANDLSVDATPRHTVLLVLIYRACVEREIIKPQSQEVQERRGIKQGVKQEARGEMT
jgi:molybdate transport system regulatory protein